jgi:hypothetical protein
MENDAPSKEMRIVLGAMILLTKVGCIALEG